MNLLQMLAMNFLRNRGTQQVASSVPQSASPNLLGMAMRMKGLGSMGSSMASIGNYGAQGGIGTGIGELSSGLGGFGLAAGVPLAADALAHATLPAISNAIFGRGTHVWEEPTKKLLNTYKQGQAYHTPVVAAELLRRGYNIRKPTQDEWGKYAYHTQGYNAGPSPWSGEGV